MKPCVSLYEVAGLCESRSSVCLRLERTTNFVVLGMCMFALGIWLMHYVGFLFGDDMMFTNFSLLYALANITTLCILMFF